MGPKTKDLPMRVSNGQSSNTNSNTTDSSYDSMFLDARKITVCPKRFTRYLTCRLCNGYLRNAHVIKECLHQFCNGCIRHHFAMDHRRRQCPYCHVDLGVKPLTRLIADPTIQDLVNKISPAEDPNQQEQEKRVFYRRLGIKRKRTDPTESVNANGSGTSTTKNGTVHGRNTSTNHRDNKTSLKRDRARERPAAVVNGTVLKISFELRAQRSADLPLVIQLPPLKYYRMETDPALKILHLRKYVVKTFQTRSPELRLDSPEQVEVLCRGQPVGPELSLEFIHRTFWRDEASKLVLEYRRRLL